MLLSFLKGIGHPSTSTSSFFDKTTRLTAGPLFLPRDVLRLLCQSWITLFDKLSFPSSNFLLFERSSVEMAGFEPATFALQRRCSPAELHPQATYLVGLTGFEPVTPALSAQCSNQLSYKPGVASLATEK